MMRRQAYHLLSLAATVLIVSGCSPFHSKLNRRVNHEVADAATAREAETAARSGLLLSSLPALHTDAEKPQAEEGKIRQLTALARLNERRDQYDQAEKAYNQLVAHDADNPLPYHRLGIMKAKQSQFDEAERLLSKAYQLSPTDSKLLSDIGYFYYLKNDEEKAEEFLRYALRFDPDNRACCNNLGILLGEQGKYTEAEAFFRRGCKEPAEVEANMAFVYSQRGELSRSIDSYSRALTLDNTLKPAAHALLNLARLQERVDSETRRSASRAVPTDNPQPVVTDLATGSSQPATVSPPVTASPPAAAKRPATATQSPAARPTGSGLLASLSNLAGSLTKPADRPANTPAAVASPSATAAVASPSATDDDASPSATDNARRQMAVRALFTSPEDETVDSPDAALPADDAPSAAAHPEDLAETAEPSQESPSDATAAPPEPKYAAAEEATSAVELSDRTAGETPQAVNGSNRSTRRLQQRLFALRSEENEGAATPQATPPRKVPTPMPASAVSVRISDLTGGPAAASGTEDKPKHAPQAETSSRHVAPASFDPSPQDTGAAGVEDLLDTWLDLTSRMPTVSTDPAESSRRVKQ